MKNEPSEEQLRSWLKIRKIVKENIETNKKTVSACDSAISDIVDNHDCKNGEEHGCEICDIINQPD